MNFPDAIRNGFRNYVNFNGRASRAEFWFWALFSWLVSAGLSGMATGLDSTFLYSLSGIVGFLLFLPSLAVTIRRLHDTGKSPLYLLINLIPLVGPFIFLAAMVKESTPGNNLYGPNPLGVMSAADYQSQQYSLMMARQAQLPAPNNFAGFTFQHQPEAEPVMVTRQTDEWAQQFNNLQQQHAVADVPAVYRKHYFTDNELGALRAGRSQAVLLDDGTGELYLAEVTWDGRDFTENRLDFGNTGNGF